MYQSVLPNHQTMIWLITFTLIVSLAGCVMILGDSNQVETDTDMGMVVTDTDLLVGSEIEDEDDDRQSESTDN